MQSRFDEEKEVIEEEKRDLLKQMIASLPDCKLKNDLEADYKLERIFGTAQWMQLTQQNVIKKFSDAINKRDFKLISEIIYLTSNESRLKDSMRGHYEKIALELMKKDEWDTAAVLYRRLGDKFNLAKAIALMYKKKTGRNLPEDAAEEPAFEIVSPQNMPEEYRNYRQKAWTLVGVEIGNLGDHKCAMYCFNCATAYKNGLEIPQPKLS